MRPRRFLTFAFAVLFLAVTPSRADDAVWTSEWEHWYTLELADATAGWVHEIVETDGTRYRTRGDISLRLGRGPTEIEISMKTEFLETIEGEPIELRFVQDMSLQKIDTRWVFDDDGVAVTARHGGGVIEQFEPLPEQAWLTPMSAHRYLLARLAAGATSITYWTLSGETGLEPISMTFELIGDDEAEVDGRKMPVTVWTAATSAQPGLTTTSMISADGHLIHDEGNLPLGRMVTRITTREQAMAAMGGKAPELMVRLFVAVDRPIARSRDSRTATLRVRAREGDLPELPSAGAQRVKRGDDARSAMLHVDLDDPLPATDEERGGDAYLKPSAMVDSGDALIRKLARHATRGKDDPLDKALALHRFVRGHISAKSLDTAFATASETARTRTGDCSEHGVLLCALLRAEGVPARVATGLVYADQFAGEQDIFGWHMWTQALIDGHWIDLDATLEQPYDAAHILTGTSSLAESLGSSDMSSIILLLGNLEVEVIDIGY